MPIESARGSGKTPSKPPRAKQTEKITRKKLAEEGRNFTTQKGGTRAYRLVRGGGKCLKKGSNESKRNIATQEQGRIKRN